MRVHTFAAKAGLIKREATLTLTDKTSWCILANALCST